MFGGLDGIITTFAIVSGGVVFFSPEPLPLLHVALFRDYLSPLPLLLLLLLTQVASVAGSTLPIEVVILTGFAKLLGDGLSMGIGDWCVCVSQQAVVILARAH